MPCFHPVLQELLAAGGLTAETAAAIHDEHLAQGRPIREIAVEKGFIEETAYLAALARMLDTEVADLSSLPLLPDPETLLPGSIAHLYETVPIQTDGDSALFAVSDWPGPTVTDDLAFVLSKRIRYVAAEKEAVQERLLQLYGEPGDSISDLLAELEPPPEEPSAPADLEHAASSTPVIRFVNLVLLQAVEDRASDIHFEPFEQEFRIRCRVDGALSELPPPPPGLALPIISRLKVIAGLDIAESRLPQDGRIQLPIAGRTIDFRVSTLPTRFGESVVLRVLDRSNVQLELDQIGFPDDIRGRFLEEIHKPGGILIVTGPTGSGKTTTLYAALQRINQPDVKILTAEDPVEYDLEGLIQLPIRENIGLGFASALRAFLRQDPDIIMVGEIRDPETARIAVQAALTGHLVFSTLHTNDAPGAVTRLIDMDVEPYLIASTLEAVLAQRLLRSVCPYCRQAYTPAGPLLDELGLDPAHLGGRPLYRGAGCPACGGSGYKGRCPVFEYMPLNDALRIAIAERRPTMALHNKAVELGMRTLREDGIRCILDGLTTVEEVIRYT